MKDHAFVAKKPNYQDYNRPVYPYCQDICCYFFHNISADWRCFLKAYAQAVVTVIHLSDARSVRGSLEFRQKTAVWADFGGKAIGPLEKSRMREADYGYLLAGGWR
jgi:hypothetical protein